MTHMDAYYNGPHRPPKHHRDDDDGDEPPREQRWHVDKGIPLALIITLTVSGLTTSAGALIYLTRLDARVVVIEAIVERQANLSNDIITLKEQVRNVERLVTRVETLLDRRTDIQKSNRVVSE